MKIAIIGDVHGRINDMYNSISSIEKLGGDSISCILQVGDFKAIRDEKDLRCFSAPEKYKTLGDFPQWYNAGEVPRKTFFISGNHDNDAWHSKHPEGSEIIKGLFYLGRSGVININGLNVGFISGNYSPTGYGSTNGDRKYRHFNSEDIQRVLSHKGSIDLLLLHEWPSVRSLEKHISEEPSNPFLLEGAIKRGLGSEELYGLVEKLRPRYVFAGHMHMPFDLKLEIGGSKVHFVSLNELPYENSIVLLDAEKGEVTGYGKSKDIFEAVPPSETGRVKAAFEHLEKNRHDSAIDSFESILSQECSEKSRSLCNYGLGVAYLKRNRERGFFCKEDIEKSIEHIRKSSEGSRFPDAHMMEGYALKSKIGLMVLKEGTRGKKKLAGLIDEAIREFKNAAILNKGFVSQAKEEISDLERQKGCLE